ncbi:sodium/hydrogen exchanger [Chloropicon primus]|uniref:Sodium/hydrogen exchanger n=1 Tax=Chloropicon primus TaxID=1764295 RepID=A0A5B8MH47_9CHLO|nr:sodium/hydrogen exchanger [Chloropicon primus]UPQ98613.1 sodium/hydrogen exchanger [Chloropicon primus]|mmetsp:Transcript_10204/g.28879  ORF Transcript_10204/g.28879 Transcript_10204/m.28879 type:complete len:543 (+) Transcript_10204:137-1765(+)|eukprot:QDZ19404.1 sodium/hydrogen exchanger [Chloropicon primus]
MESSGPAEEAGESSEALAILSQMCLIIVVFIVGWLLEKRHVTWISEASVGLIIGVGAGGLAFAATSKFESKAYSEWMNFSPDFFFFALLPPIIFDAGYSLDPQLFFGNFDAICTLAFLGTFVSAIIITVLVWGCGALGLCYELSIIQAGLFGSLISATDPVTTLAILGNVKADQNLYYLIFGESVLNDAVAIVMYQTLNGFQHQSFSAGSLGKAFGVFLMIFVGSCLIGAGFGLLSSLFYRFAQFKKEEHYDIVEACLLVPVPVAAYMAAEGAGLSGIVSILFCGIVMARYTRQNLSKKTSDTSLNFFKIVARVAETFVFIYMGLSLFLGHQTFDMVSMWVLFLIAFVGMLLARVCNVFPGTLLVNTRRNSLRKISKNHQIFLWFSGLRGAIAFALAMKSTADVGDEAGAVIFSTTLLIVLVTVLVFGGFTPFMLSKLDVLDKNAPYSNLDAGGQSEDVAFAHFGGHNKDHRSDNDISSGRETSVEMAEFEGSPERYITQVELRSEAGSSDTPLRKFIRTASGKLTVEEIDKGLHKVFVSPQ